MNTGVRVVELVWQMLQIRKVTPAHAQTEQQENTVKIVRIPS